MSWLRVGDDAATYPDLLKIAGMPGADERTVLEAFGFLVAAATLSAAHLTDYWLNIGTLQLVGGGRTRPLIRYCEKAGLITKSTQDGEKGYLLIQDPNFLHMQSRAEVERRRNHDADVSDESITVPVRLRDGDSCRWCNLPVVWTGPKGRNRGEYDHLIPGERATIDTLVVSCRSCNGARKKDVIAWAADHELHPEPKNPLYGKATTNWLRQRGYPDLEQNFASDDSYATRVEAKQQAAAEKQRRTQAAETKNVSAPHAGSSEKKQRRTTILERDSHESGSRTGTIPPKSPAPSPAKVSPLHYRESRLSGSGRVSTIHNHLLEEPDIQTEDPPAWAGTPWPTDTDAGTPQSSTNQKPKRRRGKRGGRKR